ncbi:hypothetical protein GQ42DRAFT_156995 [Ramicandelaber brevisporus]|nr:hypothetical protein GQ42DRAFT_156995 [Ramicandelaber brevisporus]
MGPLSGPNGSVVDYLTAAELHVVTKSSALRTNTRHRYTVAVEEYDVLHVRYLFSVLMSLGAAVSEGASREPLEILLRRVRVATSQYGRVLEEVPYGSAPGGSTRDFAVALDRNFGDMAPVWLLTATAAAYWEAYGEKNVGNSGAWWAIELCSVLAVFKPTVLTEARWEGWHHFEVSDFGQTSSISQIVESRKWQPVDTAVAAMALANNRVKTAKIEWCATPDAARDEDYLNISHAH